MAQVLELVGLGVGPALAQMAGDSQTEALTALGTNQATGLALANTISVFTTVAASTGANLPPASTAGQNPTWRVLNLGAQTLSIYGANGTSDTINNTAGSTAFTVSANNGATFRRNLAGNGWFATQGF